MLFKNKEQGKNYFSNNNVLFWATYIYTDNGTKTFYSNCYW